MEHSDEIRVDPIQSTRRDCRTGQGVRRSNGKNVPPPSEVLPFSSPITIIRVPIAIRWVIMKDFLLRSSLKEADIGTPTEETAGNLNKMIHTVTAARPSEKYIPVVTDLMYRSGIPWDSQTFPEDSKEHISS